MNRVSFPLIDMRATGINIKELREVRGLAVPDIQTFLGFSAPQAIYKWQRGDSLPSVENLYALSKILNCTMDQIIVAQNLHVSTDEQSNAGSSSVVFYVTINIDFIIVHLICSCH